MTSNINFGERNYNRNKEKQLLNLFFWKKVWWILRSQMF